MNAVAIILGIVIIILFFVLYKYFTTTATLLTPRTIIKLKENQASNTITKIDNPTSNQYAHGIWVYVNSWDKDIEKTFINYTGSMKIYIDKYRPILKVDIMVNKNPVTTIVTENFPLQKWVFIIASLDNEFLDVYLDGKLIKSAKFSPNTPDVASSTPEITLGNKPFVPFDAFLTKFYRWSVAMDPGTAWNYYMKGNGQNTLLGSATAYGVNMQVLQNNVETASYKLM